MPVDEELRRAFETLSDHLRNTLSRELEAIAARIADEAGAERDQAVAAARAERDEAVAAARAEHQQALDAASIEREQAIAAAAGEAAADARQQARADAEREIAARIADAAAEAEARGRQAAAAEGRQRTAQLEAQLADAERRAREAQDDSRAAIERAAEAARTARPAGAAPLERLLDAMRAIDEARSLTGILEALVAGASREAARAGVLLVRGAALRTWRFAGFGDRFDESHAFDVKLSDAGLVAEAVRTKETTAGDSASAPAFAGLEPGGAAVAAPLLLAGDIVAVLYADQGHGSAADFARPVELLARHAASAVEAVTALKAARALVDGPSPSAARPEDPEESARRYARLLVSEIKLYHEDDLLAGRRERNIAVRLAGEIERARSLYDARVPPAVRAGHDHFHSELVRTLASGDPSLLGEVKA